MMYPGERWSQCDVSAARQAEIDRLVSGKSFLPVDAPPNGGAGAGGRDGHDADAPAAPAAAPAGAVGSEKERDKAKKKELQPALVDGTPYRVTAPHFLLI